jgi:hypothetical protein
MENRNINRINPKLDSNENFLIYMYHAANLLDLFVLWVLGWSWGASFAIGIPIGLYFPMFLFIIIGILSVIITYRYIIPRMLRKENPHDALFIIQMILTFGAIIPSILGLLFGVIGLIDFNTIYWLVSFTFILFGFGHSLFLHFFKIQPFLKSFEGTQVTEDFKE